MNKQTEVNSKNTPGAYVVEISIVKANENVEFTYIMFTYANNETELKEICLEQAQKKFNGEISIENVYKLDWGSFYGVITDYT